MRIINSPRWVGGVIEPIQNLSSLGYDSDGIPTHLIDSVSGNNADIIGGNCFKGNTSAWCSVGNIAAFEVANIEIEYYFNRSNNSAVGRPFGIQNTSTGGFDAFLAVGSRQVEIFVRGSVGITSPLYTLGEDNKFNVKIFNGTGTSYINGVAGTTVTTNLVYTSGGFTSIGALRSTGISPITANDSMWDFRIYQLDISGNRIAQLLHIPMCEKVRTTVIHMYYDVSSNSYNSTVNSPALANNGVKTSKGDYAQLGYLDDGINQIVPILEDGTAFADGTALSDPNAILQDGTKWLRNGTKLKQSTTDAALIAADSEELWYTSGVANEVTDSNLVLFAASYPTIYGATYDTDFIKGITLTQI